MTASALPEIMLSIRAALKGRDLGARDLLCAVVADGAELHGDVEALQVVKIFDALGISLRDDDREARHVEGIGKEHALRAFGRYGKARGGKVERVAHDRRENGVELELLDVEGRPHLVGGGLCKIELKADQLIRFAVVEFKGRESAFRCHRERARGKGRPGGEHHCCRAEKVLLERGERHGEDPLLGELE